MILSAFASICHNLSHAPVIAGFAGSNFVTVSCKLQSGVGWKLDLAYILTITNFVDESRSRGGMPGRIVLLTVS